MRVLLWVDMEGMSRVTDHRECWPCFPQYWATGRDKFTAETGAAAAGLLEGGARDVFVVNAHGLGWPNLDWERLPAGVGPADEEAWARGFDVAFMVGFHARFGTGDGFISHTMVPGLAVRVGGQPVTECHIWAWLTGLPVLGITGDRALGPQLDGPLERTPFLAVKRSTSRAETAPIHEGPSQSYHAITEFAAGCAQMPGAPLDVESPLVVEMSMPEELVEAARGREGLEQIAPDAVRKTATEWTRDAQPALEAAMAAALQPLRAAQGELDLSSQEHMYGQDPKALLRFRTFFSDWVQSQ